MMVAITFDDGKQDHNDFCGADFGEMWVSWVVLFCKRIVMKVR